MSVGYASFAGSLRATATAYVRPFLYLKTIVASGVQKVWPGADAVVVNIMFAAAIVGVAFAVGSVTQLRTPPEIYRTRVGEVRTIRLVDGSTVLLAPQTEIRVQYVPEFRSVDVRGGEAYFEVSRDAFRPFQVSVNGTVLRAVGTAFSLRDRAGEPPELVVTQGSVAVFGWLRTAAPATPESAIRVGRNQVLAFRDRDPTAVRTLDPPDLERKLAWRDGRIVLDGEPLGRVVEQVNLFSARRLVIDDPLLAKVRISGAFRMTELDGILMALGQFGIQYRVVTHAGAEEVHLFAPRK